MVYLEIRNAPYGNISQVVFLVSRGLPRNKKRSLCKIYTNPVSDFLVNHSTPLCKLRLLATPIAGLSNICTLVYLDLRRRSVLRLRRSGSPGHTNWRIQQNGTDSEPGTGHLAG